jgi:anti-sigma regulatory factor (Ser/Thr protein kinase)
MNQQHAFDLSAPVSIPLPPSIQLECSLPREVAAISAFVDTFILMLTQCRYIARSQDDIEIASHQALNNAAVRGNHADPEQMAVFRCHCESSEVSIMVWDEGQEVDVNQIAPTARGTICSPHGRGIYLMKTFMDEARFEQGGSLVHMRKRPPRAEPHVPRSSWL